MSTARLTLAFVLVLALLAPGASQSLAQPAASPAAAPVAPASPAAPGAMLIVENAGQWPENARFQVWNSPLGAGTTWLTEDAIWLVVARGRSQVASGKLHVAGSEGFVGPSADLQPANLPPATLHALKLTFPGSNPDVRIEPFGAADTTVSYFLGDDPEQWRPDVPVWGGVRYADLYPGVDLVMGGHDGAWRFEAASGATTDLVRVQAEGADLMSIDGAVLRLAGVKGMVSLRLPSAPFVYQVASLSCEGKTQVSAMHPEPRLSSSTDVTSDSGDLRYSSFLGSGGNDHGSAIAEDGTGSAYIAGYTYSTSFPTTPGAFDPSFNGNVDAFAAKLNPDGSGLAYATFLGGGSFDLGTAIAVDDAGSAHVVGWAFGNFPTTPGAFDPTFSGGLGPDAYVVKLNPAGSELTYATYLGSVNVDEAYAVAVDAAGNAYVTGRTDSSGFPTTPGAFDTSYNGGDCGGFPCPDAFVVKLNPAGSALAYATFLGGSHSEGMNVAIAVDETGSVHVTGFTHSGDFPTTPGALDPSYNGGDCGGYPCSDAFLARFNPAGSELVFATYLGGGRGDYGDSIAIDGAGCAYVTGNTDSADFPTTPGASDTSYNDGGDAFVVKLSPSGSALTYATYLGGAGSETGRGIALDGLGSAHVTGNTSSMDFPTTPGAYDTSFNGGVDAFVAKLNAPGSALAYATFLGGSGGNDFGRGIAVDATGRWYVVGQTSSSDFPVTSGSFDTSFNGETDAFVAMLSTAPQPHWSRWLPIMLRQR